MFPGFPEERLTGSFRWDDDDFNDVGGEKGTGCAGRCLPSSFYCPVTVDLRVVEPDGCTSNNPGQQMRLSNSLEQKMDQQEDQ